MPGKIPPNTVYSLLRDWSVVRLSPFVVQLNAGKVHFCGADEVFCIDLVIPRGGHIPGPKKTVAKTKSDMAQLVGD